MINFLIFQELTSTNDYLKRNASILPSGTVIAAFKQSAGRGQKGNSWESEPGKNSTLSLLLKKPNIAVKEQFYLSEAVSLAIVDVLEQYAHGFKIKWPNDIYYNDRKISGILIEHSLSGEGIEHTIIGAGVNINQQVFISGAPNPVSLSNITGQLYKTVQLTEQLGEKIMEYCQFDGSREQLEALHQRYLEHLYRYDGEPHTFLSPQGDQFEAVIHSIAPDGTLTLLHTLDNTLHDYRFKEVGFVRPMVQAEASGKTCFGIGEAQPIDAERAG